MNTKIMVALLIHVALAVFFMVAIWPALNGSSDGYKAKPVTVASTPTEELLAVVEDLGGEVEQLPMAEEPAVVAEEVVVAIIEESVVDDVAAIDEEPTAEEVTAVEEPVVENTATAVADGALYSVVDGNKLDAESYAGFKLYRNWCARCHGTYGQGMVGPSLPESLKFINKEEFMKTVRDGKAGTIGSMPSWKANVKVMEGLDQLYAYLMARSDGEIGEIKPQKQ